MRISTIIPAFNRAELIGETLRTVLSQSRAPHEVIVVDDGSSDGTPDVVSEQFGAEVTLIVQKNAGAGAARNAGIARSAGEIIHFQDSDDLSSLNTYEVQAAAIEGGADMVYGPWLKTRFEGKQLKPEPFVLQQRPVPDTTNLHLLTMMTEWVTVFQPCLFRRELIERTGPYRTDLKPSEDSEMLFRITRATRKLAHTSETILLYRVHPENQISEQDLKNRLIDRANLWALFHNYACDEPRMIAWLSMLFKIKMLEVADEVRPYDEERAQLLERHTSALHRIAKPLRSFVLRARRKAGVLASGNPYGRVFQAGPLTHTQRHEIARLGYHLPTSV